MLVDTCILNCNDQYTLPTITFVGGETQTLSFNIYHGSKQLPFELTGCESNFAVVSFLNSDGFPIISKEMSVVANASGEADSALSVRLDAAETVGLSGKYIYQISIKDASGATAIPKKGILLISRNINPSFIK